MGPGDRTTVTFTTTQALNGRVERWQSVQLSRSSPAQQFTFACSAALSSAVAGVEDSVTSRLLSFALAQAGTRAMPALAREGGDGHAPPVLLGSCPLEEATPMYYSCSHQTIRVSTTEDQEEVRIPRASGWRGWESRQQPKDTGLPLQPGGGGGEKSPGWLLLFQSHTGKSRKMRQENVSP